MKALWALLLLCPMAYPATAQSPKATPAPRKDECSIAGMVVKLAGSEPLKKATVQLASADDRTRSITTSTDAGGRFQLKGLDPGRYSLTVMRNGFVAQEYGQKTPNDPGSALSLRPGQDIKDMLFRMIPSAVIAGRVVDEEGEALPWTEVNALRQMYSEGKRKLSMETTATTNDLGEYRLFGLPPGRYFVSATYRIDAFNRTTIQLAAGESAEQGYAPAYYPGSPDPAKAVALTIKAGEEIPSVEILLRPLTAFTVRGRVYNMVSKRSNAGVMVHLVPRNTGLAWWNIQGGAQANVENQDGMFEIHAVLPGSYTALAYWFEEGKRYWARQVLEVGNADVDGVVLTIAPGISVSGRIQWEGQPSLAGRGELSVFVRGTESERSDASAQVTGDAFTLKDVPEGVYRLNVFGQSQDCFLKSVRFGGTESLDNTFSVRRGVEGALEVTLSSRGARIQGAVADADSLPEAGVWVVLVPDEPRRNQFWLYRAGNTDQYGRFDLHGIAPGSYKLFSWEKVERYSWEDPDFLGPFEDKGERISVQEGESKSVDLVAIRTASGEQQKP